MKPAKREWALIAAYVLYMIFSYSMQSFMAAYASPEKMNQVYIWNIAGIVFGALALPLLLPLRYLREGRRPPRYALKLAVSASLFLPGIMLRFLSPQNLWLGSRAISAFSSFENGAATALIFGCFFSLVRKNRAFWSALSLSAGLFVLYLTLGQTRAFFLPYLFTGSGLTMVIASVLVLLFLATVPKTEGTDSVPQNIAVKQRVEEVLKKPRVPLSFLFPLLAAFIIFLTNSFTNQLIWQILNTPFSPGFNPSTVTMLALLIFFGFLAGLSWRRFLNLFVPISSGLLLLSPSLLLLSRSQGLFLVLYTLNVSLLQMLSAFFPFIIVDLYWQNTRQKRPGGRCYLAWLLPVSIQLIRSNAALQTALFKNIPLGNAYAVILLTLAAIVFFVLIRVSLRDSAVIAVDSIPLLSREESFLAHKLTDREAMTAELILEGMDNDEIKEKMLVSLPTVKKHVGEILRKYKVKRRTEFMAKLVRETERPEQ